MDIFLTCFVTLRKIARDGRVVNQASGEESTSMLEDSRITEDVPEISTDLGQSVKHRTELETTPRTASILMISRPGRCRHIFSKISVGSVVR